jgi:hypothetical protein
MIFCEKKLGGNVCRVIAMMMMTTTVRDRTGVIAIMPAMTVTVTGMYQDVILCHFKETVMKTVTLR